MPIRRGCCRCRPTSIEQAIEVNGVAIKMNTQAFQLGRLAAADPARLVAMMKGQDETVAPKTLDAMSLDEIIAHRSAFLTDYQNEKLAERYRKLVTQVRDAALNGGFGDALPRAVAINYAKLLAYKDEYEVARLYTDGRFEKQLRDQFDGDFKISFNLAPPMLAGGTDALGRPRKRAFGAWMMPLFRLLAKMRGLRGTAFDIFGYSADRRLERDLIAGYEKDVAHVLGSAFAADAGYRDRNSLAAGSHPRLRPGEGESGAGRQGALRATGRRPRQSAAGAAADRGGVIGCEPVSASPKGTITSASLGSK